MPHANALPEDINAFSRKNAIEISHTRFVADAERLVKILKNVLEEVSNQKKLKKEAERSQQKKAEEEKRGYVEKIKVSDQG